MPSGITQPLYDGESLSFPEFASRTARWVSPWNVYEREAPLDRPLPDAFDSVDDGYYEKRFHDIAMELAEVASWTPEVAEQKAHGVNLSRLKSHLQSVRSSREHLRQYEYMSAQVGAWVAPSDKHEGMRAQMQNQLDETYKYTRESVYATPPEKVTGEQLREARLGQLAADIVRVESRLGEQDLRLEEDSAFAYDFKASLDGWQDVPVARRVLP